MFSKSKIAIFKAISPVHAGSGVELGSVDMPIQKDPNTNLPKFESSTIKGSLRNHLKNNNEINLNDIFGTGNDNNEESSDKNAGKVSFSDAKLLFYPIKSDEGFYKLVTCDFILKNFFDLSRLSDESCKLEYNFTTTTGKYFPITKQNKNNSDIYLDSYKFSFENNSMTDSLASYLNDTFTNGEPNKFIIINDSDFIDLIEMNRFIITRNKIDEFTGTTAVGGLFTEEYLPDETILYALFYENELAEKCDDLLGKIFKQCKYFQLGGNASLGKGIIELKQLGGKIDE